MRGFRDKLRRSVQELTEEKAPIIVVPIRGMQDLLNVIDRYEDVVRDYLEWGAMTGSDRDLFERKFRIAIEQSEGRPFVPSPVDPDE